MTTVVPSAAPSSSLFPSQAEAVAKLRRDKLMLLMAGILPNVELSDEDLYSRLRVAEKELQRRLKVRLVPTKIIPHEAPQSEKDALDAAGAPWDEEPAYDYGPEMWRADRWGRIRLRSVPIISVQQVSLVYPAPNTPAFVFPNDWFRYDKKKGQLTFIPSSAANLAPIQAFTMGVMTQGRQVPYMVQVRYTAGLENVEEDWPDVIDTIYKIAAYNIAADCYLPQSGSISADGLSQSMSVDISKYGDIIETKINGGKGSNGGLMVALHGIRMGAV